MQKIGQEAWWYVSCMSHGCEALGDSGMPDLVLDRPAAYVRVIPWLASKYNIDAFLYYLVNYAYQFYPKRDPWKSVWDFSGNGDGTLFYPGRPGKYGVEEHLPVPSLRLKLWREASYDAEYIRWMNEREKQPAWWREEFAKLVQDTRRWDKEYAHYQSLRDKIGEFLHNAVEES